MKDSTLQEYSDINPIQPTEIEIAMSKTVLTNAQISAANNKVISGLLLEQAKIAAGKSD